MTRPILENIVREADARERRTNGTVTARGEIRYPGLVICIPPRHFFAAIRRARWS